MLAITLPQRCNASRILRYTWPAKLVRSAVTVFLAFPALLSAQPIPRSSTIVGPPLIMRDHAGGGEVPATIAAVSFSASIIYDVATAPASAHWYNERHPERVQKSPATAIALSVGATALPVVLGVSGTSPGMAGALITGGLILGPSVGHWYSGRAGRGVRSAFLRAGLAALTVGTLLCCT